ncbi:MAG TPA: ABC transporter permease, partial [Blastocatellia bacterium]
MFEKLLQLWRRLLFYARRNQFDRDLEEEMRFHLEMKAEENLDASVSPEEARYAARRQFGNQTLLREVSRDMWSFGSLETLAQDLRYGVRMLLKRKGFTIVAVLTLALGVGANTAIFTVVNAVLLRDLPFREAEQLAQVVRPYPNVPGGLIRLSLADFLAVRQSTRSFSAVGAYWIPPEGFTFLGGERPEQVYGAVVSADFFSTLGVSPLMGRAFQPGEDAANAERLAVISYEFWQRRFGGDRQILGRMLKLNGDGYTIIGVAPQGFWFPRGDRSEFWANLRIQPPGRIGPFFYTGLGRLRPGVTLEQANAELNTIAAQVREQFPGGGDWGTISARPLHGLMVADT